MVLLIPDLYDLEAVRAGQESSYEPLTQELDAKGIELIDAADYFAEQHAGQDFCSLFVNCPGSHFNLAGYRMLAEAVHAALVLGDPSGR